MNTQIKLTDDEIKEIKKIRDDYGRIVFSLGELYLYRVGIEKLFDELGKTEADLVNKHKELNKNESSWMESISKKYGDGDLDIEKGLFIPIEK